MERRFLTFVLFLAISILLVGNTAIAAAKSKPTPKIAAPAAIESEPNGLLPKMVFDSMILDFGKIDPDSRNKGEFKFTNKGEGGLKVNKKIKSTCGCTVPNLSKEEYAPGEAGTIKITFKASKKAGPVAKHIYVSSNDKENPKIKLTIKADVTKIIDLQPQSLSLLLNKENAACPNVVITGLDHRMFSIKGFKSSPAGITAEFDPQIKATKFVIKPKVDMEKIRKHKSGQITINLSHPQQKSLTIAYNVVPRFKITPPVLTTFKAEPKKSVSKEVYILNNYDEDFEVESVTSKNGLITVVSQEKIDASRSKIALEIIPPEKKGKKRNFTDQLIIKIKDGETLTIKCIGTYAKKTKK